MPNMRSRWLAIAVLVLPATACGGDDSQATTTFALPPTSVSPTSVASGVSTTTSPTRAPLATAATTMPVEVTSPDAPPPNTSVPAGTTLRIADQFGLFAGVLRYAGMDQDIPYDVEYTTLSPGVVQLQAFRAGEVDLGVLSPLGLVQAAVGDVDLHAVARWRTDFALQALVTAPGDTTITGWPDLRGKRVALQRDTMSEALAMLALDEAGMSLDDIEVVDVPTTQVRLALEGGNADAAVTGEPFASMYLTDNPTARHVLGIETPLAQSTIIVASDRSLDDAASSAAVAEYLSRLDRAFRKVTSDRTAFTDLVVAVWSLDRSYVDGVLQTSDGVRMERVPGDLREPFDRIAALLAQRGDIAPDLDVDALFDTRFDSLLAT